jgi:hypothetical protein
MTPTSIRDRSAFSSIFLAVAAFSCLTLSPASSGMLSQAHASETGYTYPLFDGQDIDQFVVTGCQPRIEKGVLIADGGDGFLRTLAQYNDFILKLEWKPLKDQEWDSGIYFRCEAPQAGQKWPKRYQINLREGQEGIGLGLKNAKTSGLVRRGEWNHFELRVVEHVATLSINGEPAWKTDSVEPLQGYIGIQVESPLGGAFAFRNIEVTELSHEPLFNGTDLTGWIGAAADASTCWQVENGQLVCTGKKGTWLRSEKEWSDFDLRLEYEVLAGGNSGVYIRVPKDGNHHGAGSGIEVQVLDDGDKRYKNLKAYQYTGSLYAIVPASPRVSRGPKKWNYLQISCRKGHYVVHHNGVTIIDATSEANAALAERRMAGFLGLQNHSERVAFRRVRIQDLTEKK